MRDIPNRGLFYGTMCRFIHSTPIAFHALTKIGKTVSFFKLMQGA